MTSAKRRKEVNGRARGEGGEGQITVTESNGVWISSREEVRIALLVVQQAEEQAEEQAGKQLVILLLAAEQ